MRFRASLVLASLLVVGLVVGPAAGGPAGVGASLAGDEEWAVDRWDGANAVGGAEAVDGAEAVGAAAAEPFDSDDIVLTATLSKLPERRHEYGTTFRFDLPSRVTELEVRAPADAEVVDVHGFERVDERTYEWDGTTAEPTIDARFPSTRVADEEGPLADGGRYLFRERDDWALVRLSGPNVRWRYTGSTVDIRREYEVDGEGAVGSSIAYFGEYEELRHEAHGQTFRLVVPEGTELEESPEEIFAALEHASGALRVGSRDETVLLVAAPTDADWAVRGIQIGRADAWVRADEPTDVADNVWIHEYVHTRQGYKPASDLEWFIEGSASYYAALLTLERGKIHHGEFADALRRGERSPAADAVLANRSTWEGHADYRKGALVAGDLDRRIRVETESGATLDGVFRRLNDHEGPVAGSDFERYVAEAADEGVRATAERHTRTSDGPAMWDREAQEAAFGRLPARMAYAPSDEARVSGPYRERAVDGGDDLPPLATGERLEFAVEVENVGGTAGEYDVVFRVDGEAESRRNGTLEPGERTVVTFDRAFREPGRSGVRLGERTFEVVVREPAQPRVTSLEVEPATATPGETVTVTAVVENVADVPADATLPVSVDGERVAAADVRLDVGETVRLEETLRPNRTGELQVAVGGRTRTLLVSTPVGEQMVEQMPGFGAVPAFAALLVAGVALLARRR